MVSNRLKRLPEQEVVEFRCSRLEVGAGVLHHAHSGNVAIDRAEVIRPFAKSLPKSLAYADSRRDKRMKFHSIADSPR